MAAVTSLLFATSAVVACGAPSDPTPASSSTEDAHASSSAKLTTATRLLTDNGWTLGARAFDHVADGEAASIGEIGAWTRARIEVTRASDTAHGTVILAWREGAEDVLAFTANDDDSRAALRDVLSEAPDGEPAPEAAPEEEIASGLNVEAAAACGKYQAVCTSNSQCCSGLACNLPFVGPVTKPTHRCGCASPKNYSYTEKLGTSVACFNLPDNPTGAAFWTRHKKGCGDALCRTAKGCGVACPAIVMSSSLGIECGIYNGHC